VKTCFSGRVSPEGGKNYRRDTDIALEGKRVSYLREYVTGKILKKRSRRERPKISTDRFGPNAVFPKGNKNA